MIVESDDSLLSRVYSLSSAMKPTIHIAYERQNEIVSTIRSKSCPAIADELKDVKPETKAKANTARGLTEIPKTCQVFYTLMKPESKKKKDNCFLLYYPGYSVLVSEDAKEVEVLPDDAQYYFDSKRFYINIGEEQRKYKFEIKRELFDLVLHKHYQNTLEPFFLLYLATGVIPPNTNLSSGFYSKVIFNKTFLIYYSMIPHRFLSHEIMNSWCVASISNFDYIFTNVHKYFFKQRDKVEISLDNKCFIFKVIEVYLKVDETFKSFLTLFEKFEGDPIQWYLERFNRIEVNSHTHMALFIVYHEFCTKYTPEFAHQVLCKILYYSRIRHTLVAKQNPHVEDLDRIHSLSKEVDPNIKSQLYQAIDGLCKQPVNYTPKRTTMVVYAAYSTLLENIISNNIDFLSIIRSMSK